MEQILPGASRRPYPHLDFRRLASKAVRMDFCGLARPEAATPRTLRVRDTWVTQPRAGQDSGQNRGRGSGLGREALRQTVAAALTPCRGVLVTRGCSTPRLTAAPALLSPSPVFTGAAPVIWGDQLSWPLWAAP